MTLESDTLNTFISPSAFTLFMAFRMEGAANNVANEWELTPLIRDFGGWWGVHLRTNGGVHTVEAYNWDTNSDVVTKTISLDTDYVVMVRHESGNLYISINNGSESSVASGDTGDLTNVVNIAKGVSTWFNGKIGEFILYDAALSGADLTDAHSYFSRWYVTAAPPPEPVTLNNYKFVRTGSGMSTGERIK
jgi:hypothetical protein